MKNNRNTIYFMVGSLGLFLLYYLVMTTFYPPKTVAPASVPPPAVATEAAPVQAPAPASTPQIPAQPEKEKAILPPVDAKTFALENDSLKLTWRMGDGTLTQVTWLKDGTPFFPVPQPESKSQREVLAFPGLGGALDVRFEGEPQVTRTDDGTVVTFSNATGDVLTYRIPAKGHVLDVTWLSPKGAALALIRKPLDAKEAVGLGSVYTLQDKSISKVTWDSMLTDPWFASMGRKRKVLPAEASRLGMDVGVKPHGEPSPHHYFSALWELPKVAGLDQVQHPGYHLSPEAGKPVTARLYLGPKEIKSLEAFAPAFKQVVDFGFFGIIAQFLFWLIQHLQRWIGNWGWTLIVFSILIRVSLWSLNTKSTMGMLRMKDLEPHQKALQAKYEKYGNDMTKKAEMQKELMAFYKKNGHNPMGSCLPMLLQMPVFMALWSMIQNVYELRHAPWMFWIQDLSAPEPSFIPGLPIRVLPLLLGVTMVVQSKMTPGMGDPAQRKMMTWLMPVMMVFFFNNMASGLCLYYLTYNLVHIFHTWLLMRSYKPQPVVV